MSSYSGKCDLADSISIFGIDSILKSTIYVNDIGPLKFTESKDLIPYYPYIITIMFSSKDSKFINLSSKSFVDLKEQESIGWIIMDCVYYYRKFKREKVEFTFDNILKRDPWSCSYRQELWKEVISRIKEFPKINKDYGSTREIDINKLDYIVKEYFYDLHDSIHTMYRLKLINEAIENNIGNHPLIVNQIKKCKEYNELMIKYNIENDLTKEIYEKLLTK